MLFRSIYTLFAISVPASATLTDFNDQINPTSELILETMFGKDGPMTIPVVIETVPLYTYATYALNDSCAYEQTATYYMPATAESIAYNEALVKKIQSGNIGELTDSSFDSKQYLKVSTTIRYTLYPDSKNKISDYMVGITSVAIDRDKDPEPGYLIGIGTPKVRVVQRGITELEENYVEQEFTSTVNWGSNGIPTPSDWVPIVTTSYSAIYNCFANFTVDLVYYNTTDGAYTVSNSFFRPLDK